MPSLAALPQQTDADLLRPLMLANDRPYAVAGGFLNCANPTESNVQSCQAGPHLHRPPPERSKAEQHAAFPSHIKQRP